MTDFVVADLHIGHSGIVKERHGRKQRPFDTIEQHDEAIATYWNETVGPTDKVYVLGDVAWKKRGLQLLAKMHGKKHLIKGNHDIFDLQDYLPYFYQIGSCRVMQEHGLIMTHIPIHPNQLERFKFNVHGHLHDETVVIDSTGLQDKRYLCVSLEQTNYRPMALEEILACRPV